MAERCYLYLISGLQQLRASRYNPSRMLLADLAGRHALTYIAFQTPSKPVTTTKEMLVVTAALEYL